MPYPQFPTTASILAERERGELEVLLGGGAQANAPVEPIAAVDKVDEPERELVIDEPPPAVHETLRL